MEYFKIDRPLHRRRVGWTHCFLTPPQPQPKTFNFEREWMDADGMWREGRRDPLSGERKGSLGGRVAA